MKTKILKSHKSKTSKTKTSKSKTSKSKKSKTKSSKFIHNAIKHKEIKRKITRKVARQFEIDRVSKIAKLIPQFTKFYNKVTNDELIALKYYKGYGSFWQTEFLTNEKNPREIYFPFHISQEQYFRRDIFGPNSKKYPMLKSFDIKDIPNYIKNNYEARIKILNDLDSIYNKTDCPRLSGNEILFRGMTLPKTFKKYKEGDTFTFKNFISTTADRSISEMYSRGGVLFILQDLTNIPFLYMPYSKINKYTGIDYSKYMGLESPYHDLSEYTLPRNLEFKIDKIEDGFVSPEHVFQFSWLRNKNKKNISTFTKLNKLLKQKGIIKSVNTNNNTTNNTEENIIEKEIFPKMKLYYCSFTKWHPREPLNYDTMMKDAKYVLDEDALSSWNLHP